MTDEMREAFEIHTKSLKMGFSDVSFETHPTKFYYYDPSIQNRFNDWQSACEFQKEVDAKIAEPFSDGILAADAIRNQTNE